MDIRYLLLLFLGVGATTSQAQDGQAEVFSLEASIDYALQHSTQMRNTQLDLEEARQQVNEVRSSGLPQINGSVEFNHFLDIPVQIIPDFISPVVVGTLEQFQLIPAGSTDQLGEPQGQPAKFGTDNRLTASLQLQTMVFDAAYFIGLKAAKELTSLTQRQANLTEYELRYTVMSAYHTVLVINENQSTLENNITNLRKILEETQVLYDNGFIEQLDVDRLTFQLQNLETELNVIKRQSELALNALKFQMNYPLEQPISLSDDINTLLAKQDAEVNLEDDVDYSERIELDIMRQSQYLTELEIKAIRSRYYPSLSAFATHQQVLQRDNLFDNDAPGFFPTSIVGVKLNVPIFDSFQKKAQVAQKKIAHERQEIQMQDFKRGAELEIRNSRITYKNAQERLANQEKNVRLAERILQTTQIKYDEGVGSSLDVTQAQSDLYNAQADYTNALYDLLVAYRDLQKAQGK